MFKLKKTKQKTAARRGELTTNHGVVQTPLFMPVATQGAVKHLDTSAIAALGFEQILSNTYHLMLRPGDELIKTQGGLHQFMNWPQSILTDSGGFQVFSLAKNRNKSGENLVKLTKRGVIFQSYVDGRTFELTPEESLRLQCAFGVDIAVCLDECVALPATKAKLAKAVELTTAWAERARTYQQKIKGQKPLLFCVVQGGLDHDLRAQSLTGLKNIGFDGYNIGGLSVGETALQMYDVLDKLMPAMPKDKPRYLMGVGYPDNIVEAVRRGVDMFDCVIPTREGRHGKLFLFKTGAEKMISDYLSGTTKKLGEFYEEQNIANAKFANDKQPINLNSTQTELRRLSRAYLHYLFKINEPLGLRLASLNNLEFYSKLMMIIRKAI